MWLNKKTNITFAPITFGDYLIKEAMPQEWQAFRAFYLRALKEHPGASSQSYEDKKGEADKEWERLISASWEDPRSVLCCVIHKPSGNLVGILHIAGSAESKLSHEAQVRAFYIIPEHQDDELLMFVWQSMFKYFAQFTDINKLKAAVLTTDRNTITLFNELGFVRYGYDEGYFRVGRTYLDAILMLKRL